VQTVDATGCGDAFVAGLLSRLVEQVEPSSDRFARLGGESLRAVLRYANAVGALTSLKRGVIPALPFAEQVDAFLAEQG
jgi:sugar/nucleoside kinase (ribokinase family)